MIFEIGFLWETFSAAGFEGSLEERTALDHPLGGCEPLIENWKKVHLSHVDPTLPKPDFFTTFKPGFGVMPKVLNQPILKKHFDETGELLPVKFGDVDAYLFHSLKELDALDKKRSRFWTLSNGYVICKSPVFRSSFHTQHWFFRIPGSKALFTTSEFVSCYQEQGFTGLEFHPQGISEA